MFDRRNSYKPHPCENQTRKDGAPARQKQIPRFARNDNFLVGEVASDECLVASEKKRKN